MKTAFVINAKIGTRTIKVCLSDQIIPWRYAYKYPEIYAEVFRHYGVDHFDNYREFDTPMEATINAPGYNVRLILNRVWNKGETTCSSRRGGFRAALITVSRTTHVLP